ncbi:MAG: tRNA preQ1(34) S-adenosylmethionine ribosyltransferase-isomerase QueA [Kiritimatiellaceae bacterium]|nr:tRNA preQ1(34) S-adenosylmethionine ribosyltransferase-isomerase QueA [Kiritimatiellaceae bacterium]
METALFNYDLPDQLIAQQPMEQRDASRMLVLHRETGDIEHRTIREIGDYLTPKDCLVLNNTKVIPARLFGKKQTGGKIEILLLNEDKPEYWRVLLKSSRRPIPGSNLIFCNGKLHAVMIENGKEGEALLHFKSEKPLLELLDEHGLPPLPPYIHRATPDAYTSDRERYQTVYARKPGAAAAPTAGLHFTPELLDNLKQEGINNCELTLHVGLGTFRPVTAKIITDHTMHAERCEISSSTAKQLCHTREKGGRIIAVGSTSVRTLESLPSLKPFSGSTDIFIYPPYTFQHTDGILTNFHLPKSTLLMMMAAFTDRKTLLHTYKEAVSKNYRFFSYGDCMLIV